MAFIMSNTVSETALIKSYIFPDKHQRFAMINDIYHVKYRVRNSLDKLERIAPINIKGLP